MIEALLVSLHSCTMQLLSNTAGVSGRCDWPF